MKHPEAANLEGKWINGYQALGEGAVITNGPEGFFRVMHMF